MSFSQLPPGERVIIGSGTVGGNVSGLAGNSYQPSNWNGFDFFHQPNYARFESVWGVMAREVLLEAADLSGNPMSVDNAREIINRSYAVGNSIENFYEAIDSIYAPNNYHSYSVGNISTSITSAVKGYWESVNDVTISYTGNYFPDIEYLMNIALYQLHFPEGVLLSESRISSFVYEDILLGTGSEYGSSSGSDLLYFAHEMHETIYGRGGNDIYIFSDGSNTVYDGHGSDIYSFSGNIDVIIYQQYRGEKNISHDLHGDLNIADYSSNEIDRISGVDRVVFADGTLAFDVDGNAGQAYRLYQAAFDRVPDADGLGYWIGRLDSGTTTLNAVADSFLHSPEFIRTYGTSETVGNAEFVNLLYLHTLSREYDRSGLDYWVEKLDTHQTNRGDLLAFFSESNENVARVADVIDNGIWLA